ncbi:MAG: hypothetical protein WC073_11340 [Sterolibacterium sp.]
MVAGEKSPVLIVPLRRAFYLENQKMPDDVVIEPQTPEQERQSAEAAFAATSEAPPTDKVAAAEVPEVKAVENPTEAAPEVKEPDPWEGVPKVVREKLEGIDGKFGSFDALRNDMKAGIGRIAAIQGELAAAKASAKATDNAPTAAQIDEASKSLEKWDELKAEFEDWSLGIDERIAERNAALRADILKQVPQVDVDGIKEWTGKSIQESNAITRELVRLDNKYPTWDEDTRSEKFVAWNAAQPPEIQALAQSNNSRDASKMLDLYYDHLKKEAKREKNQQRLESAIPAQGTPGPITQTPSDREAAERAFAAA